MRTALYILWALLPAFFFILTLWAKLEQISNKTKKERPGDLLRQGFFVLACVGISILIDQTVLEGFVESFSPDFIPLGFYQIILLPLVLVIAAKIFGGSKPIRVTKVTHNSMKPRR